MQIDVKFLQLKDRDGRLVKRYQYSAIDDATRIRALQIYPEHNQDRAIQFMNYVVEKFPFRISTIQTDRVHEFQARFHWHVEDQGMRNVYSKPQTPQLNGKVERSHRKDNEYFYAIKKFYSFSDFKNQLCTYIKGYNSFPMRPLKWQSPKAVLQNFLTLGVTYH